MLNRVKEVRLFDKGFKYGLRHSTYGIKKERTLVIEGTTSYKFSKVADIVESFCITMTQECVGFKYNNNNVLLYGATSKIRIQDRFQFDNNVFVTLKPENKSTKIK